MRLGDKNRGRRAALQSLVISQLGAGDHVVVRTSRSTYQFWVEFPDQAIGVLFGGTMSAPTRVRLSSESAATLDASVEPLRVGERGRVVVLGPQGCPIRGFVTSTIVEIIVDSSRIAAA